MAITGAVAQQHATAAHQQSAHDFMGFRRARSGRIHLRDFATPTRRVWKKVGERLLGDIPARLANTMFASSASTVFPMTMASYWKVPFEWTKNTAPSEDALQDGLSWLRGSDAPQPVELVADVLANWPGPEDRHAVERLGAEDAARRILALASGFSYLPE